MSIDVSPLDWFPAISIWNRNDRAVGPGTAVDALLAVKEIVYEKKEMSLAELGKVMAENWKGHEALRLRMLRSKRKWGNNDPEANALGAELIDCYAGCLNGKPNSRGGIFLACGHCARQFIDLGRRTGATPDGRRKGDEMSKNLSPTMSVDTDTLKLARAARRCRAGAWRWGTRRLPVRRP